MFGEGPDAARIVLAVFSILVSAWLPRFMRVSSSMESEYEWN